MDWYVIVLIAISSLIFLTILLCLGLHRHVCKRSYRTIESIDKFAENFYEADRNGYCTFLANMVQCTKCFAICPSLTAASDRSEGDFYDDHAFPPSDGFRPFIASHRTYLGQYLRGAERRQ